VEQGLMRTPALLAHLTQASVFLLWVVCWSIVRYHLLLASPYAYDTCQPDRADIIETPWVNPTISWGLLFFTDPLTVAFVEDPTRRTTKTNAQRYIPGCVPT